MRPLPWLWLVSFLLLPSQARAQAPLAWKLQDRFYAEVTSSRQQSTKLQGRSAEQSRDLTLLLAVRPQPKSPDGTRVIELKVESVKVTSPARFKAPEEGLLKALEGADLRVTLGPDFRVQQIEGLAEVVKNLAGAQTALPPAVGEAMQASFEGLLNFVASELFVPLPEKSVAKGATWEQKTKLRLPPLGVLDLAKELTYEGKGRLPYQSLERVTATGTFRHAAVPGEAAKGVKLVKADVRTGEYKGTLHFDVAAGRLAHAEVKTKTDVAVSLVVNKQKTQTQGVQEETLTIRTYDSKPAGK